MKNKPETPYRKGAFEVGPVYGVPLIKTMPLGSGTMQQQMPTRQDLQDVRQRSERVVAGYEVLLSHYYATKSLLEAVTEVLKAEPGSKSQGAKVKS